VTASRVIAPEPRPTSDVPYHHDRAPGQKYLLLDRSVVAESPIYVALRRIDGVPPGQPRWLDPHGHLCNSFYVFLGDGEDLGGLAGEVVVGEERFDVRSPSAVLIPPFVLHQYWLEGGSGWYLQITLAPTYEGSLAERSDWRGDLGAEHRGRLYRPAEPDGERLRLIDDGLFREPGISVDVVEVPLGTALPAAGPGLHVVLSRSAAPALVSLDGRLGRRLSSPVAILSDVGDPSLQRVSGRPLIVRIWPAQALHPIDQPGG
jgi:hypothetical protein